MLQNDYLVAKIGVDTAENEPRKEWCVVANWDYPIRSNAELIEALNGGTWDESSIDVVVCPVALQALSVKEALKPSVKVFDLGCIEADLCK